MDQIERVRASNPGRPKRIGRSGVRGGGAARRRRSPRRGIAGIGQIGRYGARLGLRFDRGGVRDVRCPPGGLFGPGEAQSTEFGGHGGSRRRGTPEHGVRAARGATDYTNRPKKRSAAGGILTGSWDSGASWKRGSPARSSGAGRSGVVMRSKTGGFLRPGPTG